jgi:hypothetical protein
LHLSISKAFEHYYQALNESKSGEYQLEMKETLATMHLAKITHPLSARTFHFAERVFI